MPRSPHRGGQVPSLQPKLGRGPRVGGPTAGVAQLAEHLICNQGVVGSTPIVGSTRGGLRNTVGFAGRACSPRVPRLRSGCSMETRHLTDDTGAERSWRAPLRRRAPGSKVACVCTAHRAHRPDPSRPDRNEGRFQSGQMGQTVNLVVSPSAVRIRLSPPVHARQRKLVGRRSATAGSRNCARVSVPFLPDPALLRPPPRFFGWGRRARARAPSNRLPAMAGRPQA